MTGESFIDVDSAHRPKAGQVVSGDVFVSRRIKEEGRLVSVLSDGLGSGVKAGVLANLTATMALRYTAAFVDVRKSAGTIMDTLPVCEVRKISYSTFTIVDLNQTGSARIIEHGNPRIMLLRGTKPVPLEPSEITLENWKDRTIRYSEFEAQLGDRIVCLSDGVTQSGLGRRGFPLGWGADNVTRFVQDQISTTPDISANELSRNVVQAALENDQGTARDDITCGVVYFRQPRQLLVLTGPPFSKERDAEIADLLLNFEGRKAICGGTTANIIGRQLNRPVRALLDKLDPEIPPPAAMEGVDLITEGTMTLARVAEMMEGRVPEPWPDNPAHDLLKLMLASDVVQFVVGTRINEAHQDPNVPMELDLRRNIIRRIAHSLENKFLKRTSVRFL
jgi:hypothetical protein